MCFRLYAILPNFIKILSGVGRVITISFTQTLVFITLQACAQDFVPVNLKFDNQFQRHVAPSIILSMIYHQKLFRDKRSHVRLCTPDNGYAKGLGKIGSAFEA